MNKKETPMQKAQNVIKILSLFFSIIFINSAKGQHILNGKYSYLAPLQEHYNYYLFNKNGQFEHHRGASLGDDYYGQGEYKLSGNQLILNYNKTEPLKISYHISKIWTNNKDSIYVHFNFLDFDGNPISYVNIAYKDSLSKYGYNGITANKDGTASLNFKKDANELQFEISSLNYGIPTSLYYSIYKLTINKECNYDITAFLQKAASGLPILNQIDTLVIDKKKPKYFTVKNKNGSITTWKRLDE